VRLQFVDFPSLWVIIFYRPVCYLPCLCSIYQSLMIFFKHRVWRLKASNHTTSGISTQRLSKQTSEFGVSVRYVNLLIGPHAFLLRRNSQSWDYFPKCKKTFVDLDRFLLLDSFNGSYTLPFRSSQVNDLQLTDNRVVWVWGVNLLQGQAKHSVRSTWSQIHFVASNCFVPYTVMIQVQNVVVGINFHIRQVFDCVHVVVVPFQF